MPTEKAAAEKKAAAFTKENLLSSRRFQNNRDARFQNNRDALAVCLTDGKKYTIEEAEKKLGAFLKGRV